MQVRAPGRVNLIGDHTDYTGGLVLPMAIDRWTTIEFERVDDIVDLLSHNEPGRARIDLRRPFDSALVPSWGRYVAAVASLMSSPVGLRGTVSTTIPVGGGLSSSAALEISAALALGWTGSALELARLTREAEHLATGVPTGIMDQLCIASARVGHATLIDCRTLDVTQVPIPDGAKVVVRFVTHRTLDGSEYATRVAECAAAERAIGPLREAAVDDLRLVPDPVVRARARHVVGENDRVRQMAAALDAGDLPAAGRLMIESHHSLAVDYQTSTPQMDAAVAELIATPGVFGARITGGGFGGCVVALCDADVDIDTITGGWLVRPVDGALQPAAADET